MQQHFAASSRADEFYSGIMTEYLNIAVEGCCHGELDEIYRAVGAQEYRTGRKVDLLVVCGDFECIRDIVDLECLAVPQKYRKLNTFHQYVTGEKIAPVTTLFVGGNHEASNVLQSLYYGGYVAPKIYFMGFAGVVNFRGIRIAGLSGIFNERHYRMGHFERPPYSEGTLRSVYHLRELEVYRMAHLSHSAQPVDVFLSHDWPAQIWEYGNKARLLKIKPYFRDDMQSGKLGNPPLMHLLQSIKPAFWFAAHLHVKFAATVPHFAAQTFDDQAQQQQQHQRRQDSRPPPPSTAPVPALVPGLPTSDTLSGSDAASLGTFDGSGDASGSGYSSGSPRPPPPTGPRPPPPLPSSTLSEDGGSGISSSALPSLEDAASLVSGSSPRPPPPPLQPPAASVVGTIHDRLSHTYTGTGTGRAAASPITQADAGTAIAGESAQRASSSDAPGESSGLGKRGAANQRTYSGDSTSNYNAPPQRAVTQFLALDKVLPGRDFLEFLQVPVHAATSPSGAQGQAATKSEELQFDLEWLAVLRRTHTLLQTHGGVVHMPQQINPVTSEEVEEIRNLIIHEYGSLTIPQVGPMQPIVIAGDCLPPRISSGGAGSGKGSGAGYYGPSTGSVGAGVGGGTESETADSEGGGYSSSSSAVQSGAHGGYGHYGPASQVESGLTGGRGGGRGGSHGRGGRSGRGGGRQGPQSHRHLFNPTGRVTPLGNPQTDRLLGALGLPHIWTIPYDDTGLAATQASVSHQLTQEAVQQLEEGLESDDLLASFSADLTAARAKLAGISGVGGETTEQACSQGYIGVSGTSAASPYLADDYGLSAYYGTTATVAPSASNDIPVDIQQAGVGQEHRSVAADPDELEI